jgi:aromatic ring-opening dioxygenase catalytic subunit (LigB family)
LLKESDIEARVDDRRGFDHGLFVPLKIMYPDAHIPCVQLSLVSEALAALRRQNVLVLGSGFSFHNMRAFFSSSQDDTDSGNEAFQQWLLETCTRTDIPPEERQQRLIDWELAPSALYCHPREEHLMPLLVCYGFAASPAAVVFDGRVVRKRALGLLW